VAVATTAGRKSSDTDKESAMLLTDARHAVRSLWHSKGFTIVAMLCLGLGIGLNTTIFSVMDGVVLKPYPYPDPDRIMVVQAQHRATGVEEAGISFLDMRDWNAANSVFTSIAAAAGRSMTVTSPGADPERYLGAGVSWDLFPMLGTAPIRGQHFTRDQDQVGGAAVVLLSHDLWTRRFASDPDIVGKTLTINSRPHVVVGVMPPGFAFPQTQKLWVPLAQLVGKSARGDRGLFAFGRLKPGVTEVEATRELDGIAARLAADYPATNDGWTSRLRNLREVFLPPDVPRVISMMMVGATLVLFIACSNVANLLLSRATSRRRELSVRTALGAGRGRIIRQLLTESVVLGLVSLPLGIGLAQIGTGLIAAAMPVDQVPYYITWEMDWRSLVYSAAIAVSTAIIFGLFPALQATGGTLHESLKEGTRGNSASRSKLRSALVIAQVSLALVALVGALLFVRSFRNLDLADVGFDPRPLMTMRFYLGGEVYEAADAKLRRVEDVMTRIETLPGVQAGFASNFVPLSGGGGGGPVIIEGTPSEGRIAPTITLIGVTPGFVKTLGLPVLRGRDFTRAEGYTRTPLALVNDSMARRFWPDGDPIGRRFRMEGADDVWFSVIGVVGDANLYGVEPENTQPPVAAFVPYAYQQALNTGLTLRVIGEPSAITPPARAQLRAADPELPLSQVRTMEEVRRLGFWQYGLYGWIFGTIGIVGLALSAVGVYGVLSYSVSQRTQEIGVRVALGAARRDVVRLVVTSGVTLAAIGVGIGLVLAPLMTFFGQAMFYNISPFDPVTFGSVALFLLFVAFIASYLPARRATRVSPVTALRGE
jgi:putative ABC transport system permease protein